MTKVCEEYRIKNEAIKRMRKLRLSPYVISMYSKGLLCKSYEDRLFELNAQERDSVEDYERDNNVYIYHVIQVNTNFGMIYMYLYVPTDDNTWIDENDDIDNGLVLCYANNISNPSLSQNGDISFKTVFGALRRIF